MKNFKATFGWYFSSPDEDCVPSRYGKPVSYLVQAKDEEAAKRYAKRFEGVDVQYREGLSALLSIDLATPDEVAALRPLSNLESLR